MTFLLPSKNVQQKDVQQKTADSVQLSGWHHLPSIIGETIVHKFTYWHQQPQSGMRYGSELYTLLRSYPLDERLKACDIACKYTDRGIDVCITASKTAYSVWLNLRSLSAAPDTLFQSLSEGLSGKESGS